MPNAFLHSKDIRCLSVLRHRKSEQDTKRDKESERTKKRQLCIVNEILKDWILLKWNCTVLVPQEAVTLLLGVPIRTAYELAAVQVSSLHATFIVA